MNDQPYSLLVVRFSLKPFTSDKSLNYRKRYISETKIRIINKNTFLKKVSNDCV